MTEDYKKQLDETPKVSQFYGRKSMTSNELLSSGLKLKRHASKVVFPQASKQGKEFVVCSSPIRRSRSSQGMHSHRSSPHKSSVHSDRSPELKNLSNFRENRERMQELQVQKMSESPDM